MLICVVCNRGGKTDAKKFLEFDGADEGISVIPGDLC